MPLCPCAFLFLFFDRQFGSSTVVPGAINVPLLPRSDYAPFGKVIQHIAPAYLIRVPFFLDEIMTCLYLKHLVVMTLKFP